MLLLLLLLGNGNQLNSSLLDDWSSLNVNHLSLDWSSLNVGNLRLLDGLSLNVCYLSRLLLPTTATDMGVKSLTV